MSRRSSRKNVRRVIARDPWRRCRWLPSRMPCPGIFDQKPRGGRNAVALDRNRDQPQRRPRCQGAKIATIVRWSRCRRAAAIHAAAGAVAATRAGISRSSLAERTRRHRRRPMRRPAQDAWWKSLVGRFTSAGCHRGRPSTVKGRKITHHARHQQDERSLRLWIARRSIPTTRR